MNTEDVTVSDLKAQSVRHVALLRGVNVSGKHLLPMKELAALFSHAGCRDVSTYIQSGNVVFSASPALAGRVSVQIRRQISEVFGFDAPLVMRSAAEMGAVVASNPFLKAGADESRQYVMFLADEPSFEKISKLDPARSAPDAFALRGREIYLHLPNGGGNTKFTNAYFDAKLQTISTARNWRTVLKLFEMLESL